MAPVCSCFFEVCARLLGICMILASYGWFPEALGEDVPKHRLQGQVRTINVNPNFAKWPDKKHILFYLDPNYSTSEQYLIRQAAWKVASDLGNCVAFEETSATDARHKIHVTPMGPSGNPEKYCMAYAGMVSRLVPSREQRHVIARGPDGCLDSLRSVMKYWVITLGRRNEHQRGDRDLYITVDMPNVLFPDAYRLYSHAEAFWGSMPYDYCSITHNKESDYATAGKTAFWFKTDPHGTSDVPQLSYTDCFLICGNYGCDTSRCASYDCTAARQNGTFPSLATNQNAPITTRVPRRGSGSTQHNTPVPKPTPRPALKTTARMTTAFRSATEKPTLLPIIPLPPTVKTVEPAADPTTLETTSSTGLYPTTPRMEKDTTTETKPSTKPPPNAVPVIPSTTLAMDNRCPLASFCDAVPDESTYLLGPFLPPQTYVLFSGECVAEYQMDWVTSKFHILSGPQTIVSYLQGPAAGKITPPVTFAYTKMSSVGYEVVLQGQMSSTALDCNVDTNKASHAAVCPDRDTPTPLISTDVGTSATSQMNIGDNTVAHYVVNKEQTEIMLMDESFKKTCRTTTNLLGGQSKIQKITAIQLMQDLVNVHAPRMAVTGTGSDNKAYVGFVDMPLEAECAVPFTTSWVDEPALLSSRINNCPVPAVSKRVFRKSALKNHPEKFPKHSKVDAVPDLLVAEVG